MDRFENITARLRVAQERAVDSEGKSVEFSLLEGILERAVQPLEGKRLAQMDIFSTQPPSLENLARFIHNKAEVLLETSGLRPYDLTLEVAEGRRVTYRK